MNRQPLTPQGRAVLAEVIAWGAGGVVAGLILIAVHFLNVDHQPRLVGHGCEGSAGPLYASEESDFPVCAAIEPRR